MGINRKNIKKEKVSIFGPINVVDHRDSHLKVLVWLVGPNYGGNAKLSYKNTDSFIVPVKLEDLYQYPAGDVEKTFDNSSENKENWI